MRETRNYAIVAFVVVALAVLGLRPFLAADADRGVLLAAALAYPVQVVAFGLLLRYRSEMKRFLAAWVGGTVVRMALVLGAGVFLAFRESPPPMPTLLALAGFFFVLLLLEAVFFRRGLAEPATGS